MDNTEYIEGLDEVWQRVVQGMKQTQVQQDNRDSLHGLEKLIESKRMCIKMYKYLLARLSGQSRHDLTEMLKDEKSHLCKLYTLYYIRTGERFKLRDIPLNRERDTRRILRQCYLSEEASCMEYAKMAINSTDTDAAEVYNAISADEKRHSRIILTALSRIIYQNKYV